MNMSKLESENEKSARSMFGEEVIFYLQRKHAGGTSGAKGHKYEDIFAAVQIADGARRFVENGVTITIEAQAPWFFVDDLVVRDESCDAMTCFQLKNSPGVSWHGGAHSIAEDFTNQLRLSNADGQKNVRLTLVVSDRQRAESLKAEIPVEISADTQVIWLPWEEKTSLLCEKWAGEFEAIGWLSKHAVPDVQQLTEVLVILRAVWGDMKGPVAVSAVIEAARTISPIMIRPLVADEALQGNIREDFTNALAKIENFSYSIVKGFFVWEFFSPNGASSRGVFREDCLSDAFRGFQERVVRRQPATLDEIEEELL